MKKNILAIGIICLFLLTGLNAVSAENTKSVYQTSEDLPDFVFCSFGGDLSNDVHDLAFSVENKGANYEGDTVSLKIWFIGYPESEQILQAHRDYTYYNTQSFMLPKPAEKMFYLLRIQVDPNNEITEANDNNNKATLRLLYPPVGGSGILFRLLICALNPRYTIST